MQPKITGENDERVGISVIDNNDIEHLIEMEFDGEIKYHEQDGYPDNPAKRSDEGSEHVEQARRYAQYYVWAERGYDTVRPEIHPERLWAVRHAITSLSTAAFEAQFGDLYQQLQSHQDSNVRRVVGIPADAASPESVLYRKDLYLSFDPRETTLEAYARGLAADHGLSLTEVDQPAASSSEVTRWEAFAEDLAEISEEYDIDPEDAIALEWVSDLYVAYIDDAGLEHVPEVDGPFDRPRDALIELPVMKTGGDLETFQEYIAFNLRCQIRDCFIRMGVQPPEQFRVLGHGRFEATEQYKRLEMFPNYADPNNETLLP